MSTHHASSTDNVLRDTRTDIPGPYPQGIYSLVGRVVMQIKNYSTGQAKQDGVCARSTQSTKAEGINTGNWRKAG